MKNNPLEPGLLPIFGVFLLIQLGLTVTNVLIHIHRGNLPGDAFSIIAVYTAGILLLLGYLFWTALAARLGRVHFPLALIFSILLSLFIQSEIIQNFTDPQQYGSNENVWQIFLFLFFPLVLVAWQYKFREVVGYSFLSAGLEVLVLHLGNYTWFHQISYQHSIFVRTIVFLAVGYVISLTMSRQREQRQRLLEANQQLRHYAAALEQLAVMQERNRISRELHDTLAHTLSGLAVQLEAARSLWQSAPERSYVLLEESLRATRTGLMESRKAIQALRASPLDDFGLILALRNLAEEAASRSGATLQLELPASLENLSPDVEQCIFRVTQEALENIVRHAEAGCISVLLAQEAKRLTLRISDNGQGFDPATVDANEHLGLKGLRERVALFGGILEIHSQLGQGATICLVLEQPE